MLGLREFCYNCLKGFSCKSSYENHQCNTEIIKTHRDTDNDPRMLNELSHYIRRSHTKGSSAETAITESEKHNLKLNIQSILFMILRQILPQTFISLIMLK